MIVTNVIKVSTKGFGDTYQWGTDIWNIWIYEFMLGLHWSCNCCNLIHIYKEQFYYEIDKIIIILKISPLEELDFSIHFKII